MGIEIGGQLFSLRSGISNNGLEAAVHPRSASWLSDARRSRSQGTSSSARRVARLITLVALLPITVTGVASADPGERIDTTSNPSEILQVGVDIAPGLWVGTSVEDYPGNCTLMNFRSYPPEYTEAGMIAWQVSDIGKPLTYRIPPGGSVKLGRGCVWARIAP